MRAFSFLTVLVFAGFLPSGSVRAQFPGELAGHVVDAATGRGVEGASVALPAQGRRTVTDAAGRFRLRSLEPGTRELVVEHPAYAPARRTLELRNGLTRTVTVELEPVLVEVEGMRVRVRERPTGGYRLVPGRAGTTGGETVGDLLRGAPGLTVTDRGFGGRQTLSIRGSGADAVLVLVDGVPLNDPLTGEADLSLVSLSTVAEVTVLPGARSARYGPRAEAGVVLVETRGAPRGPEARVRAGSLGRAQVGLEAGGVDGETGWSLAGSWHRADGGFDFRQPSEVGGGRAHRENADVERRSLRGSVETSVLGGSAEVRASWEGLERGLPGKSFAPSPDARQEEEHLRLTGSWKRMEGGVRAAVDVHGSHRRLRFRDSQPPLGTPYDETTRAWSMGLRSRITGTPGPEWLSEVATGLEVEHQSVGSEALETGAPSQRTDAAIFFSSSLAPIPSWPTVEVRGTLRLQHVGLRGGFRGSHEVAVAVPVGPLTLHGAHRSAFSPPTLADQFFREGVGVEANPSLRGERVPSEVEAGISAAVGSGDRSTSLSVTGWVGDVRDMIVWAPDFRFVWSPRNVDVRRRGLEATGEGRMPVGPGVVGASVSYGLSRVTYDRPGPEVQLRYRPRHTASARAWYRTEASRLAVSARYTGRRYPVPARVNALPGFWVLDAVLSHAVRLTGPGGLDGWRVEPTLRVERLLDATDSMIFGFPEPGRTLTLGLSVRPDHPTADSGRHR